MIRLGVFLAEVIMVGSMYVEAYFWRVMKITILGVLFLLGAWTALLWTLGTLGIGNFYQYYGPAVLECTKVIK